MWSLEMTSFDKIMGDVDNKVRIWTAFGSHNVFSLHLNTLTNLEHLVISKAAFFLHVLLKKVIDSILTEMSIIFISFGQGQNVVSFLIYSHVFFYHFATKPLTKVWKFLNIHYTRSRKFVAHTSHRSSIHDLILGNCLILVISIGAYKRSVQIMNCFIM